MVLMPLPIGLPQPTGYGFLGTFSLHRKVAGGRGLDRRGGPRRVTVDIDILA